MYKRFISKENIPKMERLEKSLKKFCHAVGCDSVGICPECCCRSKNDPMLDLDTSIAWTAAHMVSYALSHPDSCTYEYIRIVTLKAVIGYHRSKHRRLYNLLCKVTNLFGVSAFTCSDKCPL